MNTLISIFENTFNNKATSIALQWEEEDKLNSLTYQELSDTIQSIGLALIKKGIKQGDTIALIEDCSHFWQLASLSIQYAGAIDVPRGTDSTPEELAYIISHSESKIVFIHNHKLIPSIDKALSKHKFKVKTYITLTSSTNTRADSKKTSSNILQLNDLEKIGNEILAKGEKSKEIKEQQKRQLKIKSSDVLTIIYTSGTTGEPKGVQLTHGNLISQLNTLPKIVPFQKDDTIMTILPPWHIFGRIIESISLTMGIPIFYSNIKNLKVHMQKYAPTIMPAVPRIWEAVYNGVLAKVKQDNKEVIFNFFKNAAVSFNHSKSILSNKVRIAIKPSLITSLIAKIVALTKLVLLTPLKFLGQILVFKKIIAVTGGKLRYSISGGGALPSYVDEFLNAIGIQVLEGYGLTETSPVLAVRDINRIVLGTVGPLLADTQMKLIDIEGNDVTNTPGAKGTLHVKGPQVMKGYYKNPKKTKEILANDGWFNTGDLIIKTINGELSIVGRSKDTIVLLGGENVEPTPIEETLKQSEYIDNCMCIGQDKKIIGALIVPNEDALNVFAKANNLNNKKLDALLNEVAVKNLYQSEIKKYISLSTGFKAYERVGVFRLLSKPFEKGDELNNTLKVKRFVVTEKYADLITNMYK